MKYFFVRPANLFSDNAGFNQRLQTVNCTLASMQFVFVKPKLPFIAVQPECLTTTFLVFQ